jgi:hypothetical protein
VLLALAALLAHGNESGGIRSHHELIGTWAGDRIAIIGDYADLSPFSEDLAHFTDISEHILQALCEDETLRIRLIQDREVAPPHPQPLATANPNATHKAAVPSGRGAKAAGPTLKQKETHDT